MARGIENVLVTKGPCVRLGSAMYTPEIVEARRPFRVAKHTKPNAVLEKADRPAHRVIPKSRFAKLETIEDVIQKLIGV
jgi:hypothetical protein